MSGFDIVVVALALAFGFFGAWRGLARIAVGLVSAVVAYFVASRFHDAGAHWLADLFGPIEVRRLIAYLGLFLGVLALGGVIAWLTGKIVKAAALGWADRLGGASIGLLLAACIAALTVLPVVAYAPADSHVLERSTLAPYVSTLTDFAVKAAPEPLGSLYHERIGDLRKRWRRTATKAGR